MPVTLALSVAGLGTSAYLTYTHYAEPAALACPDTGVVNCVKVTTSSESMVGPVPVAVLGIVFFAGMLLLSLPWMWRARNPWVSRARLAGVAVGMVSVLYLVGVELLSLHAICLWCTAVHVLTFALFVACLAAASEWSEVRSGR
ncbi:MAG TPA: vitamin K epoxide reductase family protein [Mycobacteriales bacterium]|nr:vitamin K epoxide reductase family protein [Mycobacteriales bacterium]